MNYFLSKSGEATGLVTSYTRRELALDDCLKSEAMSK